MASPPHGQPRGRFLSTAPPALRLRPVPGRHPQPRQRRVARDTGWTRGGSRNDEKRAMAAWQATERRAQGCRAREVSRACAARS